jgi:transglutaminase-like putative cysteine protease
MWLRVEHVTRFSYDSPVREAYTELRLKPADAGGQRCSSFTLVTEPRGASIHEYVDRFGNSVQHFDVLAPHSALTVRVRSEVWTPERFDPLRAEPSLVDRWDFLHPTRYVSSEGEIGRLATTADEGEDVAATAWSLLRAVQGAMTYERGSTHVHTHAEEALADGRGVCQDFAHVLIGLCRARGIPARYVSGYLLDPAGNGDRSASHAWVDVLDPTRGWVSLDPTHDTEQTDHYIRVGVGRDYADVAPTRGVYTGNAVEELEVSVEIVEL